MVLSFPFKDPTPTAFFVVDVFLSKDIIIHPTLIFRRSWSSVASDVVTTTCERTTLSRSSLAPS